MKVAPLLHALRQEPDFECRLVHTGQHYSSEMSDVFFRDLGIPPPDHHLGAGGGTQAAQTGEIMVGFEAFLESQGQDLVIVVGDVNSTLACALVSKKCGVALAHVEAGLRSFDRTMPEEINRLATDAIADLLFTTEEAASGQLGREGVSASRIFFVGNLMIDSLRAHLERSRASSILSRLGLEAGSYGLVTLHRAANVDRADAFAELWQALAEIAKEMPLVFPVHPRTRARLEQNGGRHSMGIRLIEPLGYLDFLHLESQAAAVFTDSGGIQEETTVLGVPCFTLRDNTERPITLTMGSNCLAGTKAASILSAWRARNWKLPRRSSAASLRQPPLWDGHAAARIVAILKQFFEED